MRKKTWVLALLFGFALTPQAFAKDRVKLDGYAEWRRDGVLIVEGQRVHAGKRTEIKVLGPARDALRHSARLRSESRRPSSTGRLRPRSENRSETKRLRDVRRTTERGVRPDGRGVATARLRLRGGTSAIARETPREWSRSRARAKHLVPARAAVSERGRVSSVRDRERRLECNGSANGSVFVFSGLLRGMDDDEVAIILGHELVHATHEHSRRQYKRSMWTQLGLAGVLAAAGSRDGNACDNNRGGSVLLQTGAVIGALAFQNKYSRGHEDQADRVGLRYAYEAGYDVSKAPELWRRFAKKYGGQPQALNFFFGSHSTPNARARNLTEEIRWNYR